MRRAAAFALPALLLAGCAAASEPTIRLATPALYRAVDCEEHCSIDRCGG